MTRRLAAILAADIVGYSALMAEDETGTLEALRRLRRELFHPAVAGHRGKVVKAMGDGWLVEFASALDAVNCALQIQQGLAGDATIRVRMGVHMGDITHEEEDIYGDGVNVAARLEALADPGAVVISDAVHGALDGTLVRSFDDAGERALKNISRPLRIWVRGPMQPPTPAPFRQTGGQRAGFPVTVAIRPVLTDDRREEVRLLAAALTNDLLSYLDNGRWLSAVVSEKRPGAYVLTASLRASGDRLRLAAGLAGRTGDVIWSHRLDGSLGDSFDWQEQTGRELSSGTLAAIRATEDARLAGLGEGERTAGDWMLLASVLPRTELASAEIIFEAIERAIELDPQWGLPYAYGAFCWTTATVAGFAERLARYTSKVDEWIAKGFEFAAGDSIAELYAAYTEYVRRRAPDMFQAKLDAVLRRWPYHETALYLGGFFYIWINRPEAAVACARKMLASTAGGPDSIQANSTLGAALVILGQDEEALAVLRETLEFVPNSPYCLRLFAIAAAHSGSLGEARKAMARVLELDPDATIAKIRQRNSGFYETTEGRRYVDGLRLAGMPEGEE